MSDAEDAWCVQQYLLGRRQTELAADLGTSNSLICVRIGRFCDKWSGTIVTNGYIYNDDRKRYAALALQNFLAREGNRATAPRRVQLAQLDLWYDYAIIREFGPAVAASSRADYTFEQYWKARNTHAWLLRAEGLTYGAIGERIGVSRERARQMIMKQSRIMRWAARRACFHWEKETPRT